MIDASRHEIISLLRTVDVYGEAASLRAVVMKATPTDLRDAIKECLLSPSTMSVNRRRMGTLANALLDRVYDALTLKDKAEIRALDAEAKLKKLEEMTRQLAVPTAPIIVKAHRVTAPTRKPKRAVVTSRKR